MVLTTITMEMVILQKSFCIFDRILCTISCLKSTATNKKENMKIELKIGDYLKIMKWNFINLGWHRTMSHI